MGRMLCPLKQKTIKPPVVYGYDIETCNNNKDFVMATLYGDNGALYFYSKEDFFKEICKNKYGGAIISATNLGFDFIGTFHNTKFMNSFNTLFRGSNLILAETYIEGGKLVRNREKTKKGYASRKLTFLDTFNYAPMSVEKMGKILGIPKIDKPVFLGEKPKTVEEWQIMKHYNERDAMISKKFLDFLFNSFIELGAEPKKTIASTSMDLFKRKYLTKKFFIHSEETLLEQFLCYYGGRTEALYRGKIENMNYYDFNSLYPDVMRNELPDINSLRITRSNTRQYIDEYHGCSDVEIECPLSIDKPLLPFRTEDKKIIFPTGHISGWYTHIELREAMKVGYILKKVRKTYYYTEVCNPFKDFVTDMYAKRLEFKKRGDNMQLVAKLLMNSLYGKFGQKFMNRDNWIPCPEDLSELQKYDDIERFGNYFRIKENAKPSCFCIPIWASYITAYARIKLWKAIKDIPVAYVDTDSIVTPVTLPTSNELGALKLEMKIIRGIIVRPKFYAFLGEDDLNYIKIKGVGTKLHWYDFKALMYNPTVHYDKFMKFKESVRRNITPNIIMKVEKNLSLEDNKRTWPNLFDYEEKQISIPLHLNKLGERS